MFRARSRSRRITLAGMVLLVAAAFYGCGGAGDKPSSDEPEGGAPSGSGGKSNRAGRDSNPDGGTAGNSESAGSGGAPPACGDGHRDTGEECDDANLDANDGCDEDCQSEPSEGACGDGERDTGEQCDDGNLRRGDGCDDECRTERCGNSRIDSGEECDPPEAGECTANCSFVRTDCGNGLLDPHPSDPERNEQCDDGNGERHDGCFECRLECGDKHIDFEGGEECDPGVFPESCSDSCDWLPTCGDGVVQASTGEQCDPSNGVNCVACQRVTPSNCAGSSGAGGDAGCGGAPAECVPQGNTRLVQNGTFDVDATGWATPSASLITLTAVNDGDPSPRALEVALAEGPVRAISGAFQCIPVQADREYQLTARYRIPENAPAGVGASVTAILYANTRCEGTPVSSATGTLGSVRNVWTPYQYAVDTSPLSAEGHLLLRLNVLRPAAVAGSRVVWDSVVLSDPDPSPMGTCGDCELNAGETCDDGNGLSGDGCSAACTLERCGDGTPTVGEQCDDGNNAFGAASDTCTPNCRTPSSCDDCARTGCASTLAGCFGVTGDAAAGPGRGEARSALCDELRACVQATSCHLALRGTGTMAAAFLENCYCGTTGMEECFAEEGRANGSCRAEVEAALETTDPVTVLSRLSGADARYPLFAALEELLDCEEMACRAQCVREPTCGDGHRQDRTLNLEFSVNGQSMPCEDSFTTTGRGCSFEECDDANTTPGDGCDQYCLLETCGNYLVQAGETCDDGNTVSDDGCSATCQVDYDCGNGVVESIEECDPPGGTRVCTESEFTSNPSQCACEGGTCKRVVCGNGRVQRPLEDCDPPNGLTCGEDCKLLDEGPCQRCISENPDLGPYDAENCNGDAQCVAIKQCIIESGCAVPVAAACYCGEDTSAACEEPAFQPSGPCHELIAAAVGPPGIENARVLVLAADQTNPAGMAFLIMSEAASVCPTECFP